MAVLCPVHLVWSSGWDVAKSTDTEHTHSELCINHSAEQVIDKQLNQRHITGAALFNQLTTDRNNLSAKSKHMLFKVQIALNCMWFIKLFWNYPASIHCDQLPTTAALSCSSVASLINPGSYILVSPDPAFTTNHLTGIDKSKQERHKKTPNNHDKKKLQTHAQTRAGFRDGFLCQETFHSSWDPHRTCLWELTLSSLTNTDITISHKEETKDMVSLPHRRLR